MPTLLFKNGYRYYFFSHEGNEPPHIHVDKNEGSAKFWLKPNDLAANFNFSMKQIREAKAVIEAHQLEFLGVWNGYFSTQRR